MVVEKTRLAFERFLRFWKVEPVPKSVRQCVEDHQASIHARPPNHSTSLATFVAEQLDQALRIRSQKGAFPPTRLDSGRPWVGPFPHGAIR